MLSKISEHIALSLIVMGVWAHEGVAAGTLYQIEQNKDKFGWLNQYSLDEAQFGFIGPEACAPTSSVNGMFFLQNSYELYFNTKLTGTSYQSWIAADTKLINDEYFDTNTRIGTYQDRIPFGLEKYIVDHKGFDLISVTGMVPDLVWEFSASNEGRTPLPRPSLIQDQKPTWEFIAESLREGHPTLMTMVYPDFKSGHTVVLAGLNWNDVNGDKIIQKSEGATIQIVDPLDPSEIYVEGEPVGGTKITNAAIWNDPDSGDLLIDYMQYTGDLPYDSNDYALVANADILAVFSINTTLVKDYLLATQKSGYYVSHLPQSAIQNQLAVSTQLMRQVHLSLQGPQKDGDWSSWISTGGGRPASKGKITLPGDVGFGLEWRGMAETVIGVALGYQNTNQGWSKEFEYDLTDYSFSLYGGHRFNGWSFLGAASIGKLQYDTDRQFALGQTTRTHKGSTSGYRFALSLTANYAFNSGPITYGPEISVLAQHLKIEGFTESSSPRQQSTSLKFSDQVVNSTIATLGWNAAIELNNWTAYSKISYVQHLNATAGEIGVTSWAGSKFEAPTTPSSRDFASVSLGVVGALSDATRIGVDLNALQVKGSQSDIRATLTLNHSF